MKSKLDPNQAFRNRFLPRFANKIQPAYRVIMIHCICGRKTIVSHDQWIGEKEIPCMNCGSKHDWSVM